MTWCEVNSLLPLLRMSTGGRRSIELRLVSGLPAGGRSREEMAKTQTPLHPAIPRVHCPRCGAIMRLARIDPSEDDSRRERTTFECDCGFMYQQTDPIRSRHQIAKAEKAPKTIETALNIRCPDTGGRLTVGADAHPQALAKTWDTVLQIPCPHCSKIHKIKMREAYIASLVTERS